MLALVSSARQRLLALRALHALRRVASSNSAANGARARTSRIASTHWNGRRTLQGCANLRKNEVEVMPLSTAQCNTYTNTSAHFFLNQRNTYVLLIQLHAACRVWPVGPTNAVGGPSPLSSYSVWPAGALLVCVSVAEE